MVLYIAKASPKQFVVFFFVQCFSFFKLLQWQLLQPQVLHRSKSFREQVCARLSHRIVSYKSYRVRAPEILKPNIRVIQIVSYKSFRVRPPLHGTICMIRFVWLLFGFKISGALTRYDLYDTIRWLKHIT